MWNAFRNKVGDHDRAIITSMDRAAASQRDSFSGEVRRSGATIVTSPIAPPRARYTAGEIVAPLLSPPLEKEVGAAKQRPSIEVMMARSWSPTLFRKAFHIKGNDDLRWVGLPMLFKSSNHFLAWAPAPLSCPQVPTYAACIALHSRTPETPRLEGASIPSCRL